MGQLLCYKPHNTRELQEVINYLLMQYKTKKAPNDIRGLGAMET